MGSGGDEGGGGGWFKVLNIRRKGVTKIVSKKRFIEGVTHVNKFCWKMEKMKNFNINFKTLNFFFIKPALKHRAKAILTSSNLILKRQIKFC